MYRWFRARLLFLLQRCYYYSSSCSFALLVVVDILMGLFSTFVLLPGKLVPTVTILDYDLRSLLGAILPHKNPLERCGKVRIDIFQSIFVGGSIGVFVSELLVRHELIVRYNVDVN